MYQSRELPTVQADIIKQGNINYLAVKDLDSNEILKTNKSLLEKIKESLFHIGGERF